MNRSGGRTPSVVPFSPTALAHHLAERAVAARGSAPAVRLGVDGPVAADAQALADGVAAALTELAVPVARIRAEHFLRGRSLRLEFGADPDAFLEGWYDLAALRREALDPLGPGGSGRWLARLRDPATDRPYREPAQVAAPGTVAVLDGRFLARWEIADAVDLRVHLDVSPAARARRVPLADQDVVLPAWQAYLDLYDPVPTADVVVRFDRPTRPAVVPADGTA